MTPARLWLGAGFSPAFGRIDVSSVIGLNEASERAKQRDR